MKSKWRSHGNHVEITEIYIYTVSKETGPQTQCRCPTFNMYFHQKIALLLDPFMLSYYCRVTMVGRKFSK